MTGAAMDIRERRTLNSKSFPALAGGRRLTTRFNCGPVHYDNKDGRGDGVKGWRTIDATLVPRDDGGWEAIYNSAIVIIPAVSTGDALYRDMFGAKDQLTVLTAECKHVVAGVLMPNGIPGARGNNCILYRDAWGKDRHLVYAVGETDLAKLIVIDGPGTGKDERFPFLLTASDEQKLYRGNRDNATKLTKTTQTLKGNKKNTILRTNNGDTIIRPFLAWGINGKRIPIAVEMKSVRKNVIRLTKIIPAAFIEKAGGAVFSDATVNYDSGAGDGYTHKASADWDTAHDSATGDTADYTGNFASVATSVYDGNYRLDRAHFPVDTSAIGGDTITAAIFHVYVVFVSESGTRYMCLVQASQASPTQLTTADYNQCGAVDSPAEGAPRLAPVASAYNTMTLNATGRAWINTTGYTLLGLRTDLDCDDTAPVDFTDEAGYNLRPSEIGALQKPYLEVTHEPPAITGALMVQSF